MSALAQANLSRLHDNDPSLIRLSLEKQDLGSNLDYFEKIVEALKGNTNLKSLILKNTNLRKGLKHVYELISTNKGITELDISKNKLGMSSIAALAPAISLNFTLESIIINEYGGRKLLKKLTSISIPGSMSLDRSQITDYDQIEEIIEQNKTLKQILTGESKLLSLTNRKIQKVPQVLYSATWLIELTLSGNQLSEIDSNLYNLTNLQTLDLSDNEIYFIPSKGITKLTNLRSLDLSKNLLTFLPFELSLLPLKYFNVSQNLLASPYTFPHHGLKEKSAHVIISNAESKISPTKATSLSRLFFLGHDNSEAGVLLPHLRRIQISHQIFKFLPATQKAEIAKLKGSSSKTTTIGLEQSQLVLVNSSTSVSSKLAPDSCQQRSQPIFPNPRNFLLTTDDLALSSPRAAPMSSGAFGMTASLQVQSPNITTRRRTRHSVVGVKGAPTPTKTASETMPNLVHASCSVLDSVCSHAPELILSGKQNSNIIVITFKITEFAEMAQQLCQKLHSIVNLSHEQSSPIFLVGTYEKVADKATKIGKSLRDRITETFPGLQFSLMKICTETGRKTKLLNSKFLAVLNNAASDDLPFALLPSMCDKSWYSKHKTRLHELFESIQCQKSIIQENDSLTVLERYRESVITWDSFCEVLSTHYIRESEFKATTFFLRQIGLISHFLDVFAPQETKSITNLIFYDNEVLFQCFSSIIDLSKRTSNTSMNQTTLPVISKKQITAKWINIPANLHAEFFALLKHMGKIYEVSDEFYVETSLYSLPVCGSLDKAPEWRTANSIRESSSPTVSYIARCFIFKTMSSLCYVKLVVAIQNYVVSYISRSESLQISQIYQNCIEIEFRTPAPESELLGCCKITYDYMRNHVCLFVCEDNVNKNLFCMIAGELENIFSDTRNGFNRAEPAVCAVCVCENCVALSPALNSVSMIPMGRVEDVVASGNVFLYCGELAVRTDLIAPDVALKNLQHMSVDYSELEIVQKVGDGGFASVFYGIYKEKEIAVKILDKNDSLSESFPEFRKEVLLMAGLQHPNTVGLLGLCMQPFCVLTEFCAFGDLFSYIASRRERKLPLPVDYIMDVLVDIAHGMKFLHTAMPPIIHRDLKSPNILLCRISHDEENLPNSFPTPKFLHKNLPPPLETAKVADFGLSMRTRSAVTERVVDNPIWLAPELLAKQPYSTASDVYAFGIIANELFSLDLPFHDCEYSFMHQLEDKIIQGHRPTITQNLPEGIPKLIRQCWHAEPDMRPRFGQILTDLEKIRLHFPSTKNMALSPRTSKTLSRSATKTHCNRRKRKKFSRERVEFRTQLSKSLLEPEELNSLLLVQQMNINQSRSELLALK